MINGIALANRDKNIFCLGSDGSQQEGNDAEAARLAVAQNLNVKIIIDDNNVTIAGHPSEYLKGYDLEKTLAGHGLEVVTVQGEDIDALWAAFAKVVTHNGPVASESQSLLLPFIIFSDTGKQLFPSASWLPVFRISKEVHMVTT
jgi:transketolase N-terminal domain/subunit